MSIGLSELLVIIIIVIALFKPEKLSDYAKMPARFLMVLRLQIGSLITQLES